MADMRKLGEALIIVGVFGVGVCFLIFMWYYQNDTLRIQRRFRERKTEELQQAIESYKNTEGRLPGNFPWLAGRDEGMDICAPRVQSSTCINLESYIVPNYILSIPIDPVRRDIRYSGFFVYTEGDQFLVESRYRDL